MPNRGLSIPQPPLPMHGMSSGSSLPISNDRHGLRNHPSHHSKRPRTDHPSLHSRSPSDDHLPSGSTGYHYGAGSGGSFSRTGGPYHSGNSQYTPLYPVSNHTTPPPVFIPLQPDFGSSSSRGAAPRTAGPGPPPPAFSAARSSSANSSYDTSMYQGMMRPPQSGGSHHPGSGGGSGGGGGSDLFTAFLDADEHSRQSQGQGFGLDWPVHNSNTGSGPPPSNPPPPSGQCSCI